jgi:membrane-bound serine protease (ClpP class)
VSGGRRTYNAGMEWQRGAVAACAVALLASIPEGTVAQAPNRAGRAVVAEYDGVIHPIAAEFVQELVAHADTTGAEVLVLVLRTPGGLLESTRAIVSRMIAARTPIVVFVAPSGARAASAGFLIALAADVAAMAPGTHIGAAHPVSGTGQGVDETMQKKAASDAAAYARTLAEARGRNVVLAAEAVTESRAFTDVEALAASPPLIDLVARDVDQLLETLDDRRVARFDGRTVTLHTTGAQIERIEMTTRQRFLSAIAHPQIAYLLLTLGMLGLTVELWNPGAILPGVTGGLCLLLAFFAFQILPVNTTGLLLVLFGVVLLILELKVTSFGVLGIGGTASLLFGSLMLTREVPGIRVGYGVILPTVLAVSAIVLTLGRLALAAQRAPSVTGVEALIGERGRSITAIRTGDVGQVDVRGEIWRATSREPIGAGAPVRVADVDGLTMRVEPVSSDRGDRV